MLFYTSKFLFSNNRPLNVKFYHPTPTSKPNTPKINMYNIREAIQTSSTKIIYGKNVKSLTKRHFFAITVEINSFVAYT